MSATLRIDALKFVRRLTEVGMERRVAEAIVEGLVDADTSELATKADLVSVKADLKADIAALRTDMVEMKAEMMRFILLQAVGSVGLIVTLIKLLP